MRKRTDPAMPANPSLAQRSGFNSRDQGDGLRHWCGPVLVWSVMIACMAAAGSMAEHGSQTWAAVSPAADVATYPTP